MILANKEISQDLKKLGYDGEYKYLHVLHQQDGYQILTMEDCEKQRDGIQILCAAPSLYDVSDWLRETHGMVICVDYQSDIRERYKTARKQKELEDYGWGFKIHDLNWKEFHTHSWWFGSYDEAFEDAIEETIERVLYKLGKSECVEEIESLYQLPPIDGISEKQIAYARSIRARSIRNYRHYIYDRCFRKYPDEESRSKEVKETAIAFFDGLTAKKIIDICCSLEGGKAYRKDKYITFSDGQ